MSTLSPQEDDVPFGLAWRIDDLLAFAQVKSVSAGHESQRLRLGSASACSTATRFRQLSMSR